MIFLKLASAILRKKFEAWENKNRNPGYGRNIDRVNSEMRGQMMIQKKRGRKTPKGVRMGLSLKVVSTNVAHTEMRQVEGEKDRLSKKSVQMHC